MGGLLGINTLYKLFHFTRVGKGLTVNSVLYTTLSEQSIVHQPRRSR